jgi:hypothetical protein
VSKDGKDGSEFKMEPKQHLGFSALMPRPVELQGKQKMTKMTFSANQILVVVNNTTTGHKLQGCTKNSVFFTAFLMQRTGPMLSCPMLRHQKACIFFLPLMKAKIILLI